MTDDFIIDLKNRQITETTEHTLELVQLKSELCPEKNGYCHSVEGHVEADIPIENFLGGVEVTPEELSKVFEQYEDEENNIVDVTYGDKFPTVTSLDETKVFIRCVKPVSKTAWYGATWETVKKFYSDFGKERLLTKSKAEALLNSEAYKKIDEEI